MCCSRGKLRMRPVDVASVGKGDVILTREGELLRVVFASSPGWRFTRISCIDASKMPRVSQWANSHQILVVTDSRVKS